MRTDVVSGAHTHEIRGYKPLIVGVLAAITVMFGTVAVLTIGRNVGVALAVPVVYAALLIFGLRAQRQTVVRLTVSAAGLDVAWIFGSYRRSWEQVRRIRFLRTRWDPSRIRQIEIVFADQRPLELFDRLSDFQDLVGELREMRPQLVEE